MKLKAILYARFSPRSRAHQCPSCDVQLDDLRHYCAQRGYVIAGEFRDDAVSGKSEAKRHGLRDALAACTRGCIFLCRDQKRLSRNMLDAFALVSRMTRRGVVFETIHDGSYDPRDPNKLGMFGMRAVFAEMERLRTSIDTRAKVRRHQAEGRRMSNILPFGWMHDPSDSARMLKCPEEQAALGRLLELHRDGLDGVRLSERALARQMEAEGYEFRGKSAWNHTTVRKILRREREREPS